MFVPTAKVTPEAAGAIARKRAAHAAALADHLPAPLAGTVLGYLGCAFRGRLARTVRLPPELAVPCASRDLQALPDGRVVCSSDGLLAVYGSERPFYHVADDSRASEVILFADGRILTWDSIEFHVWTFASAAAARLTAVVRPTPGTEPGYAIEWEETTIAGSIDPAGAPVADGVDSDGVDDRLTLHIRDASTVSNKVLIVSTTKKHDVFILTDVTAKSIERVWRVAITRNHFSDITVTHSGHGRMICVKFRDRTVILGISERPICAPADVYTLLEEPAGYALVIGDPTWTTPYLRPLASLANPKTNMALPGFEGRMLGGCSQLADGTLIEFIGHSYSKLQAPDLIIVPGVRAYPDRYADRQPADAAFELDGCGETLTVWDRALRCVHFCVSADPHDTFASAVLVGDRQIAVRSSKYLYIFE